MTATLTGETAPTAAPDVTRRPPRLEAVDLLRGLVIVLMLLDHTRDFVHRDAFVFSPTDLTRTNLALFLTRWVTHLCAPTFALLAGLGAALQLKRGKSKGELSRYLVTRGFWLIVLEFTIVRFGLAYDLNYGAFPGLLEVMWMLGACMMLLAALVHLPLRAVAAIAVAIIALHNLTDGVIVAPGDAGSTGPSALGALWMLLHRPGLIPVFGAPLIVAYPLLPWLGVMMLGYALGQVYTWEPLRRSRFLVTSGLVLIAAFVLLRAMNAYGDPSRWSTRPDAVFTLLSFINTSKYPPSLLFLLMTLGPAFLLLAWFERRRVGSVGRMLITFGRVPLFFFVIQWFVAHSLAIGMSLIAGRSIAHLFGMPTATPPAPGAGFGLGMTYVAWIAGLAISYPLCRWFADVKRRRTDWWLGYL